MMRAILLALSLALAGCVTALTPSERLAPLRLAFTEPVESLQARAAAKEPAALYALSFLTLHGLRGLRANSYQTMTLRQDAGPRPTMITQYIPGVNGGSGRTAMIPVNIGGWPFSPTLLDLCGQSVLSGIAELGAIQCGGSELYDELVALAGEEPARYRARYPRTTPSTAEP